MKWYEAIQYMKYKYLKSKEDWEQTRWYGNLYINAHSKRKFTLPETIHFPWETNLEIKSDEDIRKEREIAKAEAEHVKELLRKGKAIPVTLNSLK